MFMTNIDITSNIVRHLTKEDILNLGNTNSEHLYLLRYIILQRAISSETTVIDNTIITIIRTGFVRLPIEHITGIGYKCALSEYKQIGFTENCTREITIGGISYWLFLSSYKVKYIIARVINNKSDILCGLITYNFPEYIDIDTGIPLLLKHLKYESSTLMDNEHLHVALSNLFGGGQRFGSWTDFIESSLVHTIATNYNEDKYLITRQPPNGAHRYIDV